MKQIRRLAEIAELAARTYPVRIAIQGVNVELEVRHVSAADLEAIKLAYPDPPPVFTEDKKTGRRVIDTEDPAYIERSFAVLLQRKAAQVVYMLGEDFFGEEASLGARVERLRASFGEADINNIFRAGAAASTVTPEDIEAAREALVPFDGMGSSTVE